LTGADVIPAACCVVAAEGLVSIVELTAAQHRAEPSRRLPMLSPLAARRRECGVFCEAAARTVVLRWSVPLLSADRRRVLRTTCWPAKSPGSTRLFGE
jgi:hypothetical protein